MGKVATPTRVAPVGVARQMARDTRMHRGVGRGPLVSPSEVTVARVADPWDAYQPVREWPRRRLVARRDGRPPSVRLRPREEQELVTPEGDGVPRINVSVGGVTASPRARPVEGGTVDGHLAPQIPPLRPAVVRRVEGGAPVAPRGETVAAVGPGPSLGGRAARGGDGTRKEGVVVIRLVAPETVVEPGPAAEDTRRLGSPVAPAVAIADIAVATDAACAPGEVVAKAGDDGPIGVEVSPGPEVRPTLPPRVPTFLEVQNNGDDPEIAEMVGDAVREPAQVVGVARLTLNPVTEDPVRRPPQGVPEPKTRDRVGPTVLQGAAGPFIPTTEVRGGPSSIDRVGRLISDGAPEEVTAAKTIPDLQRRLAGETLSASVVHSSGCEGRAPSHTGARLPQ